VRATKAYLGLEAVEIQLGNVLVLDPNVPAGKRSCLPGMDLDMNLTAIEEALHQTKNQSSQDPLNFPIRLNNKLAALGGVVASAESAPTAQSYAVYDEVVAGIDAQLQKLAQLMRSDVPAFNQLVRDQNIPAVVVKPSTSNP